MGGSGDGAGAVTEDEDLAGWTVAGAVGGQASGPLGDRWTSHLCAQEDLSHIISNTKRRPRAKPVMQSPSGLGGDDN